MKQLKQNVIDYFEKCLAKHGNTPQGVDYNGRESQYERFDILASIDPLRGKRILDVACGLGHFYDFLIERKMQPLKYKGVDISPMMIEGAGNNHPTVEFAVE